MNMYALMYNEFVKDLVIAHSEEEARQVMTDFFEVTGESVSSEVVAVVPCVKLDDTLQTITGNGLMTIRQIIEHYNKPYYVMAIDNKDVQFN